jgi:hypothetical protein
MALCEYIYSGHGTWLYVTTVSERCYKIVNFVKINEEGALNRFTQRMRSTNIHAATMTVLPSLVGMAGLSGGVSNVVDRVDARSILWLKNLLQEEGSPNRYPMPQIVSTRLRPPSDGHSLCRNFDICTSTVRTPT